MPRYYHKKSPSHLNRDRRRAEEKRRTAEKPEKEKSLSHCPPVNGLKSLSQ
ncbi:hypothetical protein ACOMHN_038409 [Nucella lapillus]